MWFAKVFPSSLNTSTFFFMGSSWSRDIVSYQQTHIQRWLHFFLYSYIIVCPKKHLYLLICRLMTQSSCRFWKANSEYCTFYIFIISLYHSFHCLSFPELLTGDCVIPWDYKMNYYSASEIYCVIMWLVVTNVQGRWVLYGTLLIKPKFYEKCKARLYLKPVQEKCCDFMLSCMCL